MEMHQLRYLEAVARSGSMMAAAAACHVSQPALSVQIRKLEDELGVRLLVRGARGVSLTVAGERALITARRVLRETEALRTDIKRRTLRVRPVLRVSVQPYLATELLPGPMARTIGEAASSWRIEFRELPPARLIESVARGGSDLGMLDLAAASPGALMREEIARIPYALFCPESHPLAGRGAVKLSRVIEHPVLVFQHAAGVEQRLYAAAARRSRELVVPFASEHAAAVFEMVVAGAGVAILPVSFAARAGRRRIVSRPLADYREQATIVAVWRPESELPSITQTLFAKLRDELTGDAAGGAHAG